MKKIFVIIWVFLTFCNTKTIAQTAKKIDFNFRAGFLIGASAPIGIPVSIRKIESYNPGLQLSLEAGAHYHFQSKFGLASAIRFEQKGMTTNASVKGYYTTFNEGSNGESESLTGYFTGTVETKVKNSYVTIPIHVTYSFNSPFSIHAGGFVSYLLESSFTGKAEDGYIRDKTPVGERENISEASYNFSDQVRSVNAGIELGANYKLNRHLFVSANFNYGITPLMKKDFQSIDFNLYNLYVNLGVGYHF